ncbi:MAG: hypothetical protein LBI85_05195 [Spirochaetaceae bacterium]|jgi:hypothetical protein|nr:hypothetical protein [Spirochaetaceae bacterium]
MQVLDLRNIQHKDSPIYYRRFYAGTIVMEIMRQNVERDIEFTIETTPLGSKNIKVTFSGPVDYPMVPLLKEVKSYLDEFDRKGGLPV